MYDAAARHIRGTSAVCNFPNDFSVACPDLTILAAGKRKGSGAGAQAAAAAAAAAAAVAAGSPDADSLAAAARAAKKAATKAFKRQKTTAAAAAVAAMAAAATGPVSILPRVGSADGPAAPSSGGSDGTGYGDAAAAGGAQPAGASPSRFMGAAARASPSHLSCGGVVAPRGPGALVFGAGGLAAALAVGVAGAVAGMVPAHDDHDDHHDQHGHHPHHHMPCSSSGGEEDVEGEDALFFGEGAEVGVGAVGVGGGGIHAAAAAAAATLFGAAAIGEDDDADDSDDAAANTRGACGAPGGPATAPLACLPGWAAPAGGGGVADAFHPASAGATLLGSSPGGDGGALWSSAFAGVVGAGAVF